MPCGVAGRSPIGAGGVATMCSRPRVGAVRGKGTRGRVLGCRRSNTALKPWEQHTMEPSTAAERAVALGTWYIIWGGSILCSLVAPKMHKPRVAAQIPCKPRSAENTARFLKRASHLRLPTSSCWGSVPAAQSTYCTKIERAVCANAPQRKSRTGVAGVRLLPPPSGDAYGPLGAVGDARSMRAAPLPVAPLRGW